MYFISIRQKDKQVHERANHSYLPVLSRIGATPQRNLANAKRWHDDIIILP